MGRRPSSPKSIPRLRARRKPSGTVHYYYDHGGKPRREQPLGSDYGLAVKRWADIEQDRVATERVAEVVTFRYVADHYRALVIPTKAPRTQRDNAGELTKLLAFFDDPPVPLDSIRPQDVRQYLTWRGKAPVRAKREKALLSHIFNWARDTGYTDMPNPCAGIKGKKEEGRDVYIDDDQYMAVLAEADQTLKDAMELAYLTGQRVSDTLAMDETKMRDGTVEVRQGKTRQKVRVRIVGQLAAVVDRIKARKRGCKIYSTGMIVNKHGRPLKIGAMQSRWRDACEVAGIKGIQFRDLRAKAGTDTADSTGDMRKAQQQLGHKNITTTEIYIRRRRGHKVDPTK
jgi:integrase